MPHSSRFLQTTHASQPKLTTSQIITTRKPELLSIPADEPEMLYAILSKLPKPLDLEALITRTTSLFQQHPPETLPFRVWRSVSSYSVLKTTRDPAALARQTLGDGETWLGKHARQIDRAEHRKKMLARTKLLARRYRRPAGAVGLAVLVGVLSVWLGRGELGGLGQKVWDAFGWIIARV